MNLLINVVVEKKGNYVSIFDVLFSFRYLIFYYGRKVEVARVSL